MPPRKEVPEPWASALKDVVQRLRDTRKERDEVIVNALRAGGSIREVADRVGLSHRQVLDIGHDHGWPPDDEREARKQHRARVAAERVILERIRQSREFQEALERYEPDDGLVDFEKRKGWWREVMDGTEDEER